MFGRNGNVVNVEEALRLATEDGYVILDVRTAVERREGHPPGSIHIELDSLPDGFDNLRDKKVLAFCRSGSRSGMAARFLTQHDIEAHNIKGGMVAWNRADLPVQKGL